MKKFRKLIPALCMLLISAMLMGTSTYAWFSMNTTVTASGMSVQAKSQAGIVISNAAQGTYNASATSTKNTCAVLLPGSTSDLTTWFHSASTDPGAANTQQAYTAGSAWTDNEHDANYVTHEFYVRSSAAEALAVASLDIKSVEAKVGASGAVQELSKSLRVGIKVGTQTFIYAPVTGYTASYSVTNQAGAYDDSEGKRTTVNPVAGTAVSKATGTTSIPANTSDGLLVTVYVWFEGEDTACVSNNIKATLEQLTVTVTFGYTLPTT